MNISLYSGMLVNALAMPSFFTSDPWKGEFRKGKSDAHFRTICIHSSHMSPCSDKRSELAVIDLGSTLGSNLRLGLLIVFVSFAGGPDAALSAGEWSEILLLHLLWGSRSCFL